MRWPRTTAMSPGRVTRRHQAPACRRQRELISCAHRAEEGLLEDVHTGRAVRGPDLRLVLHGRPIAHHHRRPGAVVLGVDTARRELRSEQRRLGVIVRTRGVTWFCNMARIVLSTWSTGRPPRSPIRSLTCSTFSLGSSSGLFSRVEAATDGKAPRGTETILIAEDEPDLRSRRAFFCKDMGTEYSRRRARSRRFKRRIILVGASIYC